MMPSTSFRHSWITPDQEIFSYSLWSTNDEVRPQAVVVAVHGLSGASLDFEPLGSTLVKEGIVTVALELRGQGNDPVVSRRGDLDRVETWFHDLDAFFALVRKQYPDAQIYYYGESMGAALLTRYLTREPRPIQPDGLILASPVIALAAPVAWWQEWIFQVIHFIYPRLPVDVRLFTKKGEKPKLVTRDQAHLLWFETAPHRLQVFTLRFFKNLRSLISDCMAMAPRLEIPLLLLYPGQDVFIPAELVEKFFHLIGSREKEERFYPEAYHLLLHDFDQDEVLDRIRGWLIRRIEIKQRLGAVEARFHI